jgi:dienelactone hydrolase
MDRPKIDTFLPLAFAALKELRKLPGIDSNRIGIMGFSMGGAITLSTAIEANRKLWMGDEKGFAAHAGFYPVAKAILPTIKDGNGPTGAPIIVFCGTDDAYGDGDNVPVLKNLLHIKFNFELIAYEYFGAAHGFNLNAPPITYFDPAAKHFRGHMAYDADATNDSMPKLVDFFRKNLAAR